MNNTGVYKARICGGRYDRTDAGDERDRTIAKLEMPVEFLVSPRAVVVVEADEWEEMEAALKKAISDKLRYQIALEQVKLALRRDATDTIWRDIDVPKTLSDYIDAVLGEYTA
ncbi:MAG: hypothetical protein ACOCWJ_06465 [Verrucomicrobiota bacterium]